MRFFRFREDRLPIAIILVIFAFDVFVYLRVDSIPLLAAWTVLGILPKGHICAWNHHHQHVNTFEQSVLNRALELGNRLAHAESSLLALRRFGAAGVLFTAKKA